MRILAFDHSVNASAVGVFDEVAEDKIQCVHSHVFRPKGSGIYRYIEIRDYIETRFEEFKPTFVIRELHHAMQYGAAKQLEVISGLIDVFAYDYGYLKDKAYAMVPVTMWKKFIVGKGNIKKDTAYLVHVNNAIRRCQHIKLPEKFESIDDNTADMICIAITGYCMKRMLEGKTIQTDAASSEYLTKSLHVPFEYGKIS